MVERKRGNRCVQVPQGLEGLRFAGPRAGGLARPVNINIA